MGFPPNSGRFNSHSQGTLQSVPGSFLQQTVRFPDQTHSPCFEFQSIFVATPEILEVEREKNQNDF